MSQNKVLDVLNRNRLLRHSEEIYAFENALNELAENQNSDYLEDLHLVLDDRCEQPDVMFGLIHLLESFELEEQLRAFVSIVSKLMITAPDWTQILHNRILNDEPACKLYKEILHSFNSRQPHFIYQLLEESASSRLDSMKVKEFM